VEQRACGATPGARQPDAGGALTKATRDDRGLATLEATLAITILIPLLFSILDFGSALERWLAQDAVTVHAARYAGEVGGDSAGVRSLIADQLRAAGIDPARVSVEVVPQRVGWREPVRVTVSSEYRVSIPFLFATSVPLRSSAISRGEVNR
jgi:Flp pilus assembly protein TadG